MQYRYISHELSNCTITFVIAAIQILGLFFVLFLLCTFLLCRMCNLQKTSQNPGSKDEKRGENCDWKGAMREDV